MLRRLACTEVLQTFKTPKDTRIKSPMLARDLKITVARKKTNPVVFDPRAEQERNKPGYRDYFRNTIINTNFPKKFPFLQHFASSNLRAYDIDHNYCKTGGLSRQFLVNHFLLCPDGEEAEFVRKLEQLEVDTRTQHKSKLWKNARSVRITASNFGHIIKATERRDMNKLINSIIFPRNLDNVEAIVWGRQNEKVALKKFQDSTQFTVEQAGLHINPRWPYLGASPDGLLDDGESIVEVKCPFSSRAQPITTVTVPFLEMGEDGELKLKENHIYYAQVQGQMLVTDRIFCKFIVYTTKQLICIDIPADYVFQDMMIHKLKSFWEEHFRAALLEKKVYGIGCRR